MMKQFIPFAILFWVFGLGCKKMEFDYSHTTTDRIDSIVLPDQTKMILNNYSSVYYYAPYQNAVNFGGEVYCIVKRGNGSPFRLLLGPNVIECQNGEFNVSTYQYAWKAKLGNAIETDDTPVKLMVLKGEVTIINDTTRTVIPANRNAAIYLTNISYLGAFWDEECSTWRNGYYHFIGLGYLEFKDFLQTHFQISTDADAADFYSKIIFNIDLQANKPLLPQFQKIATDNGFKIAYDEFNKTLHLSGI